jgi:hypothetical protein
LPELALQLAFADPAQGDNTPLRTYQAVHVCHDEVVRILAGDAAPAMTLCGFSEHIGIGQPVYVKRLFQNGHMTVTEMRNPRTKAFQP